MCAGRQALVFVASQPAIHNEAVEGTRNEAKRGKDINDDRLGRLRAAWRQF